ncbi:60S ribosomal protein L28-like [Stegodyphus dumicola]|uniref:60S ribosomal protein L28-like n=1 Tax=Stegodyphus dumicola TaxID=202533 RepID=UPI0015A7E1E4|nr:60S ribosomal protein L28-like [Stegodyphus dumicola]
MSSHLYWLIVRKSSSHMVKKRNIKKYFSTDPLNLKKIHSPRYCGLVQKKAIMIDPHPSSNGVTFIHKKKYSQHRPARALLRTPFTKNARRTMTNIKKFVRRFQYRKDLKMLAFKSRFKCHLNFPEAFDSHK